jgi:hypothetical protein
MWDVVLKEASQFILLLIRHSPLRNGKEREWRWKQGEHTLNLDPTNDQTPVRRLSPADVRKYKPSSDIPAMCGRDALGLPLIIFLAAYRGAYHRQ